MTRASTQNVVWIKWPLDNGRYPVQYIVVIDCSYWCK